MDMKPLRPVSIIIPTLNEEKYLPLLLESLTRVGEPMEVIVVDGMSEDKTVEVTNRFVPRFSGASSLKVVLSDKRGVAHQRNLGAAAAKNDILLFLDADVVIPSAAYYRTFVSKFVARDYVVASTLYRSAERDIRANYIFWHCMLFQLFMRLFGQSIFAGFCTMVKRSAFARVGGFNETLRVAEDVDFSRRVGKEGKSAILFSFIETSNRRFKKYGYVSTVLKWTVGLLIFFGGGMRFIQKFSYPVGVFGE